MKKQLLFLLLCLSISFIGQAQTPSIKFTSIPTSTEIGKILKVNYEYTAVSAGQIYAGVSLYDADDIFVSFVGGKGLNPAPAGTNLTGSLDITIPTKTLPTLDLPESYKYRIRIELRSAANAFIAGDYPQDPYNFTPAKNIVSFTSIPATTQVGTNLTVNYKYSAENAGILKFAITKNGGTNPWDFISSVAYAELNPAAAGSNLTGSFTVPIPANTVTTSSLTGNQNYRIKIELFSASNVYVTGNFDTVNYNFTQSLSTNDFDKENQITAYPNPVNSTLNLNSLDNIDNAKFSIVNTLGKNEVTSKSLNSKSIDVSGLSSGVYILSVEKDQKVKQIKFIKQ